MALQEVWTLAPGDWIEYGPGKYDLGEIVRVTACFPTVDVESGKRIMGMRRFHFAGGQTVDHYPHALIGTF